jgi:hypothetical protein
MDGRSVRRLIPLGFLSPRIVEAIAERRQPVDLTLEALTRRIFRCPGARSTRRSA